MSTGTTVRLRRCLSLHSRGRTMNLLRSNCTKSRGFTGGYSGITAAITPATLLTAACLVVFIILSMSACGTPTPTEPPPHLPMLSPSPTLTPSPSPTLTASTDVPTIVTPTLVSPVTLTEPKSGSEFEWGSEITLHWSSLYTLQAGECYRLKVQAEGQNALVFYSTEDDFTLSAPSSGKYEWAVAIVRSIGEDRYELVSDESDWHSFEIVPPKPVVYSISPDSTAQGRAVQVVVSGENFTRSLTLIIGVPLQVTFVDSSTITATVPITLAAGQYPVIVQDPAGGTSISSTISFTVQALPPTPTVRPPYPLPVLGWGGIIGCNVTFKWEWTRTLAKDEWFAVRVGKDPNPPRAQTWTQELQYTYVLTESGKYAWQIAICRGKPEDAHCSSLDGTELVASEYGVFEFGGCATKPPPIKPTPP